MGTRQESEDLVFPVWFGELLMKYRNRYVIREPQGVNPFLGPWLPYKNDERTVLLFSNDDWFSLTHNQALVEYFKWLASEKKLEYRKIYLWRSFYLSDRKDDVRLSCSLVRLIKFFSFHFKNGLEYLMKGTA